VRRNLSTRQPRCGDWLPEIRCELGGEDSLQKITEALRTWVTPRVVLREHASRIFTELQAEEAAWRAANDRRVVRMNGHRAEQ
jgi:hypothetical protein